MTYIKLIDEATGLELTDTDLAQYEWIETTVHSTAVDRRTFIRGRAKNTIPPPDAIPDRPIRAHEILKALGVPNCDLVKAEIYWDTIEKEPVNGYRDRIPAPTGRVVLHVRRKGE